METDTEREVRAVIERWAKAVAARDVDGVLAGHTEDVVMFDVSPPAVVKGIDAYRATWPPFFEFLRRGEGVFEIVMLDVTVGDRCTAPTPPRHAA